MTTSFIYTEHTHALIVYNNKITKIANVAWNDIQNQQDPHKRQIMIKERKIRQKENMFKNKSKIEFDSESKPKKINNRCRPLSSLTRFGRMSKSNSMTNLLRPSSSKSDINSVNNYKYNNNSILFQNTMSFKTPMNNYIKKSVQISFMLI